MGAGGVGGYFGARLQQAGHDVVFFARGKHLAAIRENGLTIESPQGNVELKVKVLADPAETEPVDAVLFAVKLWDTEKAAEQIGRSWASRPSSSRSRTASNQSTC